jgi:hypothetical protein
MPRPLSVIAMRLTPPSSSRTVICVEPASSAFSSSSLTTADGRSTTSPAAICEMSWSGSCWIGRWVETGAFIREIIACWENAKTENSSASAEAPNYARHSRGGGNDVFK